VALVVYGIVGCDSVKKVRAWLDARGSIYSFYDYKKQGVPEAELRRWVAAKGWQVVLNRKGTTWRALDESVKASVVDDASALVVMRVHASAIKRPVVTQGSAIIVGVDFEALAAALGA
jgi:arsenate reductase (glutaredoxin)